MKAKVPSGFWVYSPTRSAAVVSPSPATVIRSRRRRPRSGWSCRYRAARTAGPAPGRPQLAQGFYVGHVGEGPRAGRPAPFGRVTGPALPAWGRARAAGRARRGGGGGGAGAGAGWAEGVPWARWRRLRRRWRSWPGSGSACRYEVGLAPAGEGGQRVADRAGRLAEGLGDRRGVWGRGCRRGTRLPGGAAGRCRAGPWGRGGGAGAVIGSSVKGVREIGLRHWRARVRLRGVRKW